MTRRSMRFLFLVAAIGSAASVASNQAMAASINLDSGVQPYTLGYISNTTFTNDSQVTVAASTLLAPPAQTYTVAPGQVTPAAIAGVTTSSYGWIAASAGSSWIGPNSTGTASGTSLDNSSYFVSPFTSAQSGPQGFYYFSTTFSLPASPGYVLTGSEWSSDNQGVQIFLNGIALNMTNPNPLSFAGYSAFTAPSGDFNAGLNTLTFVMWNENYTPVHASPVGIEIEGLISTVPEPTAIVVAASGLPLIGLFWARRRRRDRLMSVSRLGVERVS